MSKAVTAGSDRAESTDELGLQHLVVHGHRRAYRMAGSGPVLLLLHGLGRDSDKPRGDYSLGAYANGMRDLLTLLGIDKVTVVGHSFGGGVAMQFAYQFPERTERLALVAPGGMGAEVTPLLRLLTLPGATTALGLAAWSPLRPFVRTGMHALKATGLQLTRDFDQVAGVYDLLCDPGGRRAFSSLARHVVDWRGQVITMTDRAYLTRLMPMCVMWGEGDMVLPSRHARTVASYAPAATVHVLPDSGHFPHRDHPELFVRLLCEFVEAEPPASYHRGRWRRLMQRGDVHTLATVDAGESPA